MDKVNIQIGDEVEVHGDLSPSHCSSKIGVVKHIFIESQRRIASVEFDEPLMHSSGGKPVPYGHNCAGKCKRYHGRYIETRYLSPVISYEIDDSVNLTEGFEILIKGEFD